MKQLRLRKNILSQRKESKMPRQSPDDSGYKIQYGHKKCPRCGDLTTTNAWGFKSHMKSCVRKTIIRNGKEYPPIPEKDIPERWR